MTTLDRHLLQKLENPKILKSTTSLDKHHLLGDQDKPQGTFPTRAVSGIPQDLVWELSLFAVGGALSLSSIGRPQDPIAVLPSLILVAGGAAVLYSTLPSVKEERKKIRV